MRMDSLQDFLSQSVNTNTLISKHQMDLVSSEITAAVHQIIVNGAAPLSCAQKVHFPNAAPVPNSSPEPLKLKSDDYDEGDSEVIKLDAVELLAEHLHFCEICGKGFKRRLRMHMRAHGDQYKTTEALSKKSEVKNPSRSTRFSCPYDGCNWNKKHLKFRPLKSVICVRNHFKRSHCPKMYSYNRKDKLFGHISLFEGHMPVVEEEPATTVAAAEDRKLKGVLTMEEDEDDLMEKEDRLEDSLSDDLLHEFGSFENYS
ncbi:transducin family protein [Hibiscus syriacus]|uniref:Transducin family protein n=1 Tax=Hibiscus syriacus TaxID=106335 RepID=A0A6A2Y8A0_HIBSY|nr:transducin family protein [Hibiscus syriacus]